VNNLVSLIAQHGYLLIFAIVLAEAIGLPVPAALALVAGGAAAASHALNLLLVVGIALLGTMLGDSLLFVLGRHMGWNLLGLLCRVSANPETCILRSAESFYKRGKITLLISKFIPGVNTMAPPLAGSMKMRTEQFLRLDLAGASLYVLAYIGLGFLFRDFLAAITRGFQAARHAMEVVLLVSLAVYVIYRIWIYRKNAAFRAVPRVQVQELAARLASVDKDKILVVDVRSHGYYDAYAARIEGSTRIEPNNLAEELKTLPKDKEIYLYCT
jgi:membrane protein DedA with SNARE-associated domain